MLTSDMNRFEILDIYGDAGIRAFGKSLDELFLNSAAGMYSLITVLENVCPQRSIKVEARSDSLEGLLVSWLNELIFHFDTYGFLGKDIHINELSDTLVRATLKGEDFDPARHVRGLLIKAATYHKLKIERKDDHWSADVIFDI